MNKQTITIVMLVLAAVIVLAVVSFWLLAQPAKSTPVTGDLGRFAQCLKDKGVTMYGAAWCSHCQNQKKLFGDAFKNVAYVECPENTQLCVDKGVSGYPTWILSSGEKLIGEQSLQTLADKTGCQLP